MLFRSSPRPDVCIGACAHLLQPLDLLPQLGHLLDVARGGGACGGLELRDFVRSFVESSVGSSQVVFKVVLLVLELLARGVRLLEAGCEVLRASWSKSADPRWRQRW